MSVSCLTVKNNQPNHFPVTYGLFLSSKPSVPLSRWGLDAMKVGVSDRGRDGYRKRGERAGSGTEVPFINTLEDFQQQEPKMLFDL